MNLYILDRNSNPIECEDIIVWSKWREKADVHISLNIIGDVKISTVFLGINHRFFGDGPPILYETMIFGGAHDGYQERYTTREEALIGHEEAIKLVKGVSND